MSLLDKLTKKSTIKNSSTLNKSTFFNDRLMTPTSSLALNLALSGDFDLGFSSGIITLAGPQATFKTTLSLVAVEAFMNKHKDAICLFYDSEHGTPPDYIEAAGIDSSRVFHCPIKTVEDLKFDIIQQLDNLDRKDKVIIFIDSIGNLASKKEMDDTLDGKSVADMSRAKALKSLFRMITPHLSELDIPLIMINHVYSEMGLFPKTIVSGGQGSLYSSNTIITLTKKQEKNSTSLLGYQFTMTIHKSRYVREKSKIPLVVLFNGGIKKYSGLLDIALETGHVRKPKNGRYENMLGVDKKTGEVMFGKDVSTKLTDKDEFWQPILENTDFKEAVKKLYSISNESLIGKDN